MYPWQPNLANAALGKSACIWIGGFDAFIINNDIAPLVSGEDCCIHVISLGGVANLLMNAIMGYCLGFEGNFQKALNQLLGVK